MLNDKSYRISQRFYCCGSKVVLNRLFNLCDPRLCSHAAKKNKQQCSLSGVISSGSGKDPTVVVKVLSYHQTLKCDLCGSKKKNSSHCLFFSLRTIFQVQNQMKWLRFSLAVYGEGVYRRRKHQGHVNKTLQRLVILLRLRHTPDCICNIRI